jgi:hypothetical protein
MSFDARTISSDTVPPTPPPEVLDAVDAAARAYGQLTAIGVQLHFHVDDQTGAVGVHISDLQGAVLSSLTSRQVLELATTGTLG